MRRTSLVRLAATAVIQFLLLGIAPEARAQEGPQPPPPFEQVYQMPVVYEVPGMEKVQVRRDIVYKTVETTKGKAELKLDLYLPAGAKKSQAFPAVILISGGGIEGGAALVDLAALVEQPSDELVLADFIFGPLVPEDAVQGRGGVARPQIRARILQVSKLARLSIAHGYSDGESNPSKSFSEV